VTPHDKLDAEVAKAIEVGPFDELTPELLPSPRAVTAAELHVYPGACHGFTVLVPEAPVTKQCMRNMEEWLRGRLRRDGSGGARAPL
jgi:hypothetical protein